MIYETYAFYIGAVIIGIFLAVIIRMFAKKCNQCGKYLSLKDKQLGGVGYSEGKDIRYCMKCTKDITKDIFEGRKPGLFKKD